MKRLNIFIIYGIFLLAVCARLGAFYSNEPVSRGDEFEVLAVVTNPSNDLFENVNVKLYIYDLGLMLTSNPFDIGDKDSGVGRIYWKVPSNIPKGSYLARLEASNTQFKDWRYMYIKVI